MFLSSTVRTIDQCSLNAMFKVSFCSRYLLLLFFFCRSSFSKFRSEINCFVFTCHFIFCITSIGDWGAVYLNKCFYKLFPLLLEKIAIFILLYNISTLRMNFGPRWTLSIIICLKFADHMWIKFASKNPLQVVLFSMFWMLRLQSELASRAMYMCLKSWQ